jgi:uncharacterized SAM-binding protein YcdF (DUF218 family)
MARQIAMMGRPAPLVPRLMLLALVPVLCWLGGFVWFAQDSRRAPAPPPHADGIVALTGGSERVTTALSLLHAGRADRLLISGVNGRAALTTLARGSGIDPATLADRVTLGHDATDTLGNAAETAAWARAKGVRSLIVVTAGYHMRRALTEMRRVLPDVAIYPAPVVPPAGLRVLAAEYTKWLVSLVGLTRRPGALPLDPTGDKSPDPIH